MAKEKKKQEKKRNTKKKEKQQKKKKKKKKDIIHGRNNARGGAPDAHLPAPPRPGQILISTHIYHIYIYIYIHIYIYIYIYMHIYTILAIFYPFSQFCEIGISLLSL